MTVIISMGAPSGQEICEVCVCVCMYVCCSEPRAEDVDLKGARAKSFTMPGKIYQHESSPPLLHHWLRVTIWQRYIAQLPTALQ